MLNFSEMGTQIRIAWRAKYKMLPVILECSSRLQVNTFYHLQACTHISVLSCLSIFHILVELILVGIQIFYFVVLNQFCDSLLKIRMACSTFVKSGNTEIISSENKITLTMPSLFSRQLITVCYVMVLQNSGGINSKQNDSEFFKSKVTSWAQKEKF